MRLSTLPYYFFLLVIGIVTVFAYSEVFSHFWYAYNPDSAAFIESARNLLAGRGLVTTPGVAVLDKDAVPLTLWPPGYPALIASGSALSGLPPKEVALWISRGATALLPVAMAFALRPLLGAGGAAAVALLALLSPYTLEHGYMAMSDLPFLLFTVVSFGLLQRSMRKRAIWVPLLASGIFAGLAYTIRNAGLAWFVAVAAAFVLSLPLRLFSLRDASLRVGIWGLGVVLAAGPMWIRNLMLSGELGTYSLGSVDGDPVGITRAYLFHLLNDLSATENIALLAWDAKLFGLIVVPLILLLFLGLALRWSRETPEVRFGLLVLPLYLGAGSAMVVIAAIKWLGGIDPRLAVQYSWLLLALGAAAVLPGKAGHWRTARLALGGLILLALLFGRAAYINKSYDRESAIANSLESNTDLDVATAALPDPSWILRMQLYRIGASDEPLVAEVKSLPPETLIVSNEGFIFRIESERAVRSVYLKNMPTPEALAKGLQQIVTDHGNRDTWFILLPSNQMLKSSASGWYRPLIDALPPSCDLHTRTQRYLTASCTQTR